MDTTTMTRVLLSFVISGLWISLATIFAEKLGSRIGGLIANLPSNILVAFIFIAITNGTEFTVESSYSVPIGMAIDSVFLFVLIVLLNRGITIAVIFSLISWLILALLSQSLDELNLITGIIIYTVLTIICFVLLEKFVKITSSKGKKVSFSFVQITIRAFFAGSIVASAVYLSTIVGPYWTGILSTFPAVLLSSMVILTINQNSGFAMATGKILLLSSSNIVVYSIIVGLTYNSLGIIVGTLIAFTGSFIWVWLFQPIAKRIK